MKNLNIVIPTINRKDLLMEAVVPINKQRHLFDKFLIVDNGNQNILPDIQELEMVKEGKVLFHHPGKNLGVSGSWNYGIMTFRDSNYILFLNDDVVIGDTQLQEIHDHLLTKEFWLATGNSLWSMFTMARPCWEYFIAHDGYVFDEKFFPAYFEDNDFHYRIVMANKAMHIGAGEMNPVLFRNSMTIKKDPKINFGFGPNQQYYVKKWGGMPGHERFTRPFNK